MNKPMKLLIGYDGSAQAQVIIKDLAQAGLPRKVEARVLSAADVILPPRPKALPAEIRPMVQGTRERAEQALRVARSLSEHGRREFKKAFPHWKVSSEACADSPAWAIVKRAEQWKPHLVAVGAHGHAAIGRFIGSVSQMVVAHCPVSVRVARRRAGPRKGNIRVLIGIDGSKDADTAVTAVTKRSWLTPPDILLVAAVQPEMSSLTARLTPAAVRWFLEQTNNERQLMSRALEFYAGKLRDTGATVINVVEPGDPKRVLLEQAAKWGADLIVVGARGLSELKRFFIGGVSAAVSARADCSVEIIRSNR